MSSATTCNYCVFKHLKKMHEKDGIEFKLRPKPDDQYPKGVSVIRKNRDGTRDDVGWFAEMSEGCSC